MMKRFGSKKSGTGTGGQGGRSPRLTDPGPGLPGNGYDCPLPPLPSEQEVNEMFLEVMETHG